MHHLFASLGPDALALLEALPQALDTVLPLRTAHKRDLPYAVRDLSRVLTSERGSLRDSYWSAPRHLSAYLRYFLPWNLVRLGKLLPNLPMPAPEAFSGRVVLDLGSGPLTLPLALWMSRPELRHAEVNIICSDVAPRPMEVGHDLFRAVTEAVSGSPSPWHIRTVRAPMETALREVRSNAILVTAGNVLNELRPRNNDEPMDDRLDELAQTLAHTLAPEGQALFVEPGTRLGGKLVAQFRRASMDAGLAPLAPCPHLAACPMLEKQASAWCHFTFGTQSPAWLATLSAKAQLEKATASIAFLLLRPIPETMRQAMEDAPELAAAPLAAQPDTLDDGDDLPQRRHPQLPPGFTALPGGPPAGMARILSDPIRIPGRLAPARYACTEKGVALVNDAASLPSGSLVTVAWPEKPRRDTKSGALEAGWQGPDGTPRGLAPQGHDPANDYNGERFHKGGFRPGQFTPHTDNDGYPHRPRTERRDGFSRDEAQHMDNQDKGRGFRKHHRNDRTTPRDDAQRAERGDNAPSADRQGQRRFQGGDRPQGPRRFHGDDRPQGQRPRDEDYGNRFDRPDRPWDGVRKTTPLNPRAELENAVLADPFGDSPYGVRKPRNGFRPQRPAGQGPARGPRGRSWDEQPRFDARPAEPRVHADDDYGNRANRPDKPWDGIKKSHGAPRGRSEGAGRQDQRPRGDREDGFSARPARSGEGRKPFGRKADGPTQGGFPRGDKWQDGRADSRHGGRKPFDRGEDRATPGYGFGEARPAPGQRPHRDDDGAAPRTHDRGERWGDRRPEGRNERRPEARTKGHTGGRFDRRPDGQHPGRTERDGFSGRDGAAPRDGQPRREGHAGGEGRFGRDDRKSGFKGGFGGRDDRKDGFKGGFGGRDERKPGNRGEFGGRDDRKDAFGGRDDRKPGFKGGFGGRDERKPGNRGEFGGRDDRKGQSFRGNDGEQRQHPAGERPSRDRFQRGDGPQRFGRGDNAADRGPRGEGRDARRPENDRGARSGFARQRDEGERGPRGGDKGRPPFRDKHVAKPHRKGPSPRRKPESEGEGRED